MLAIFSLRLVIDLKVCLENAYNPPADKVREDLSNEYWPNRFLPSHSLSTHALISKLGQTISGEPENKSLYLPRPIYVHGIRPEIVSRKFPEYRSMPQSTEEKTLTYGHPKHDGAKYTGQSQHGQRLCLFRAIFDQNRQAFIQRRRIQSGTGKHSLCLQFLHYRSPPEHISLGRITYNKNGDKAPYLFGPAGQHSGFQLYHGWQSARCKPN